VNVSGITSQPVDNSGITSQPVNDSGVTFQPVDNSGVTFQPVDYISIGKSVEGGPHFSNVVSADDGSYASLSLGGGSYASDYADGSSYTSNYVGDSSYRSGDSSYYDSEDDSSYTSTSYLSTPAGPASVDQSSRGYDTGRRRAPSVQEEGSSTG